MVRPRHLLHSITVYGGAWVTMIRAALSLLIILFLGCGQSLAKVAVSPVIIAAEKVQAGQVFEVLCRQLGRNLWRFVSPGPLRARSPGRCGSAGGCVSVERVEQLLAVERRQFLLQPGQGEVVRIKVLRTDFESSMAYCSLPQLSKEDCPPAALFCSCSTPTGRDPARCRLGRPMKTLLKALVLVLLMAPLVGAEAPILSGQGVLGRETIMIRQSVQLWVAAEGAWQLTGSSAQDVTLFDWRVNRPCLAGSWRSGPYQGSLQLECHWHSFCCRQV